MFVEGYNPKKLKPALYNPRYISSQSLERLKSSISNIGIVKPILVNSKNLTIVAGHQRLKAILELGIEKSPLFFVDNLTVHDEIRFNQLHNATDVDVIDYPVKIENLNTSKDGFLYIQPDQINGNFKSSGVVIRTEICRLLVKYGNWGCAVVSENGEVVNSPQYLLACKQLNISARIYLISNNKLESAKHHLSQQYGEFSYKLIQRETWLQSHAQMMRLRGNERQYGSELYKHFIIPNINKSQRILDFGCGQGDYVKKLTSDGYNIIGVEFYPRIKNTIDYRLLNKYIQNLFQELCFNGRFDVVICDSVLNSIDSLDAEKDLLITINALTKVGGTVYLSGRRRQYIEEQSANRKTVSTEHTYVNFVDNNGFSANFRHGGWFFQKFHSDLEIISLIEIYFPKSKYELRSRKGYSSWQVRLRKASNLEMNTAEVGINNQFNLPFPDGNLNKGKEAVKSFRKALSNE